MDFRLTRLDPGSAIIACCSLALLVVLFAFPWFGVQSDFAAAVAAAGGRVSANGWQTFTIVGPLTVIVTVLGLFTFVFALVRSSPALGMLTTIVLAPLSLLLLIWLLVRILLLAPTQHFGGPGTGNSLAAKPAAYVAIALAALIVLGVLLSLRREGVDPVDSPAEIETVALG